MDDLPVRLADFLESITVRIRSMTTDRIARYVRLGSLGVVVAALGIMALLFLLLAVYGALAIPLGADGAFAALGLITLIAGIIFWTRRSKSA